jgi:hypothetical protein
MIGALRFIAKDPDSKSNGSPTLFDNGETYVVQGWKVTDAEVLATLGDLPERETVIEIPKRLVRLLPEVTGGAAAGERPADAGERRT